MASIFSFLFHLIFLYAVDLWQSVSKSVKSVVSYLE